MAAKPNGYIDTLTVNEPIFRSGLWNDIHMRSGLQEDFMQTLIADYVGLNEKMMRMGELINKMIKAIDALEENIERLDITWSGEANT